MSKNAITPIILQTMLHGTVDETYKYMNSDGLEGAVNFLRIVNTLDVPIFISFDGIYAHEYVKTGDFIDINNQLCHPDSNKKSLFKKYTKVYVKRGTDIPKSGIVSVTGFYLED